MVNPSSSENSEYGIRLFPGAEEAAFEAWFMTEAGG